MYKQYWKKDTLKISVVLILISAFFYWMNKPVTIIINSNNTTNTTVTLQEAPQHILTIEEYIPIVFGKDAPKAFLVLQGNGPGSCAENRNLVDHQDNDNTQWGGVGKDIGYWQINTVYHPKVTEWCARDVKCSTDYAYKLFKARGNFSAWTCGRVYGV
jgi:hypothetical protein